MRRSSRLTFVMLLVPMMILAVFVPPTLATTNIVYARTWGTTVGAFGTGVVQDSNGNIYVSGDYNLTGGFVPLSSMTLLLEYDSIGNFQWARSYFGENASTSALTFDEPVRGPSNSVYLASTLDYANSTSHLYSLRAAVLRIDSTGDLVWQRSWANISVAAGVGSDAAGNVYLTGTTLRGRNPGILSSSVLLIKLNSTGSLLWQREWNASGYDLSSALALSNQGDVYVACTTNSTYSRYTPVLMKFNSTGGLEWAKSWIGGGSAILANTVFQPQQGVTIDSSGNVYLTGTMNGSGGEFMYILKFDPTGTILWERLWKEPQQFSAGVSGMAVDNSSNLYLIGSIVLNNTYPSRTNALLLKFSSSGALLSHDAWGSNGPSNDGGIGIVTAGIDTVLVAGAVSEAPPYVLSSTPLGTLLTPSGNITTPLGTVTTPASSIGFPAGHFTALSGNEIYTTGYNVFLLKVSYTPIKTPIGPATAVASAIFAIATSLVVRRSRGWRGNFSGR